MSYVPYENLQRYRLPGASFPLRFALHGQSWRFETAYVEGAGQWRCMLEGPAHWYVWAGANQASLERDLREIGVAIPARTFPGSVFRHLVRLGVAERC